MADTQKKSFTDMVRDYSAWKLQEKGNEKLTREELKNLREAYASIAKKAQLKETKQEPAKKVNPLNEALKARVAEYRKWKLAEKGSDKINEKEMDMLKKAVLQESKQAKPTEQSFDVYLANYKKFKESKDGKASKVSYKELKMLKENWKEAQTKGIKLREADAMGAPIPGDPNAMGGAQAGMDPAAGGAPAAPPQQDPMAMQGAIDQAVAALQPFTQSGANPMGADPNAGIPPVDGTQPPADPNAAAGGLMESMVKQYQAWKLQNKGSDKLSESEINMIAEQVVKTLKEQIDAQPKSKYQQIKERIAERNAKLAAMQEGYLDIPTVKELGTLTSSPHVSNSHGGGDKSTDESPYASIPSAASLAKGYTSGKASGETKSAKTWPTKAMGKETGGALQGAGATQTKVKESTEDSKPASEEEKKQDSLEESAVKTVTDVYVERHLEPKLNFDRIKESMKSGLLG